MDGSLGKSWDNHDEMGMVDTIRTIGFIMLANYIFGLILDRNQSYGDHRPGDLHSFWAFLRGQVGGGLLSGGSSEVDRFPRWQVRLQCPGLLQIHGPGQDAIKALI